MIIFLGLLILQFFVSRKSTEDLFHVLHRFLPYPLPFVIVAVLFFPGTLVHELAHFFSGIILFLKVRGLHLLPSWSHNHLVLGHVTYEKADFFRGFLVGVAPLPAGLITLWAAYEWLIVRGGENWHWVLFFYITFTITSTMFSSPSDLTDGAAFLIFSGLVLLTVYLFGVDITGIIRYAISSQNPLQPFFDVMILFLGVALAIHVLIIVLFRLLFLRGVVLHDR